MNKKETKAFKIVAFRAVDEREMCMAYISGHLKTLKNFGLNNLLVSSSEGWMHNPNVYCVVAFDESTNVMVGGVRTHVADGQMPLPMEMALGKQDESIFDLVRNLALDGGTAESCGLWVDEQVRGENISMCLMRAAISTVDQLNVTTILGICSDYAYRLFRKIGFVPDESFGEEGKFCYPNEGSITNVVLIPDLNDFSNATEVDGKEIQILRINRYQKRVEETDRMVATISYSLDYENITTKTDW